MAEPVSAGIETDPQELLQEAIETLQDRIEGWEPAPGSLDFILLEAFADMSAEVRDVASDVPAAIFRYFGAKLAGVPPIDAASAIASSTWTAIDDQGYTIAEGATVGVRAAGDDLVLFEVVSEVVIPPGQTQTGVGEVTLAAALEGAHANALGAPGGAAEPVDAELSWVDTVVLTGATAGGAAAEDDDAYLSRLADELTLQTPTPILPRDFAILARRVAGVHRALAIDLYKPADVPNPGNPVDANRPRSVTVAVVDEAGEALGAPVRAEVDALLQSMREVNFEVWVVDPAYTEVSVDFDAVSYPAWDPADVEARAVAAVEEYLSPGAWGTEPFSDEPTWTLETHVRHYELVEVLNRVEGLWRVTAIAFGVERAASIEADDDTVTLAAHGYADADPIAFVELAGGGGPLVEGTVYYVRDAAANTFKVAAAPGGAAIAIAADAPAARVAARKTADVALAGVAPLPRAGAVTGDVVAP